MTDDRETGADEAPRARAKLRVRLPGFIVEDEVGLGDAIRHATAYIGARPCGGCERRAASLNRWLVFTKGKRGAA